MRPTTDLRVVYRFTRPLRWIRRVPSDGKMSLGDPTDGIAPLVVTHLGKRYEVYVLELDYPPYFTLRRRLAGGGEGGELGRYPSLAYARAEADAGIWYQYPFSLNAWFTAAADQGVAEMLCGPHMGIYCPPTTSTNVAIWPVRDVRDTRSLYGVAIGP